MRETLYILVLILIFGSCAQKTKTIELTKTTYYYPSKTEFDDYSNLSYIILDSLKNFNELIGKIDEIVCADKVPVVNFENGSSEFNIIPLNYCYSKYPMYCSKSFLMTISPDSIEIETYKRVAIDNLSMALELNILNREKNILYGDIPAKTIFEVQVDSIYGINKTSDLLVKIAYSYNELNKKNMDSLFLKIRFAKLRKYPPPPPKELKESE